MKNLPGKPITNRFNYEKEPGGFRIKGFFRLLGHSLDLDSPSQGWLRFSFRGEPSLAYPFSCSTDLQNWKGFGFLQLGGNGEATFDLTPSAATSFLRMSPLLPE